MTIVHQVSGLQLLSAQLTFNSSIALFAKAGQKAMVKD